MQHKIRLTADWTNPETGAAHKAGDIVLVHDWQLRLESSQGLSGKYSMRLEAPAAPPQDAQETRTRAGRTRVASAEENAATGTADAAAPAPDAPPDNE